MDRSEETIEQETTPENESGEDTSNPMEALLNDKKYEQVQSLELQILISW